MTKKQYRRKMMQLQRNLNKIGKENGMKPARYVDRVNEPNWGVEILTGKYKGEKLHSYEQAWDVLCTALKGTPALDGIKVD